MVELAERLVSQIRDMDWAVFAKNGTDVTTLEQLERFALERQLGIWPAT